MCVFWVYMAALGMVGTAAGAAVPYATLLVLRSSFFTWTDANCHCEYRRIDPTTVLAPSASTPLLPPIAAATVTATATATATITSTATSTATAAVGGGGGGMAGWSWPGPAGMEDELATYASVHVVHVKNAWRKHGG
ncbi:hypothetical protein EDC01DRAFT_640044 [Geopyxis carbonaria]|nr:hypothetical protein EDC01DRAFT_640044 [Geopyxis carbonaria]